MAEPSLKRRRQAPERSLVDRAECLLKHTRFKKNIGKALGMYTATMARLDASGGGARADRNTASKRLGDIVRRAEQLLKTAAKAAAQACADAAANQRVEDKLLAIGTLPGQAAVWFHAFSYHDYVRKFGKEKLKTPTPRCSALDVGLMRCALFLPAAKLPTGVCFTTATAEVRPERRPASRPASDESDEGFRCCRRGVVRLAFNMVFKQAEQAADVDHITAVAASIKDAVVALGINSGLASPRNQLASQVVVLPQPVSMDGSGKAAQMEVLVTDLNEQPSVTASYRWRIPSSGIPEGWILKNNRLCRGPSLIRARMAAWKAWRECTLEAVDRLELDSHKKRAWEKKTAIKPLEFFNGMRVYTYRNHTYTKATAALMRRATVADDKKRARELATSRTAAYFRKIRQREARCTCAAPTSTRRTLELHRY